jgi:hypothetical protein
MFKCNCPHEVRSGCSEPECPHFDFRTLMVSEARERYPQETGSHRRAFIDGAKWARDYFIQQLHREEAQRPSDMLLPGLYEVTGKIK